MTETNPYSNGSLLHGAHGLQGRHIQGFGLEQTTTATLRQPAWAFTVAQHKAKLFGMVNVIGHTIDARTRGHKQHGFAGGWRQQLCGPQVQGRHQHPVQRLAQFQGQCAAQ